MRVRLIVGVLLVLPVVSMFPGCDDFADQNMRNKEIVLGAVDAINNQQFEEFERFFATDLKRHCQATPDVQINSLAEMIEFVKKWLTEFPDAKMETESVIAEGDLVAWYGRFVGTNENPIGTIPATGKRVDSETFSFFRIEEGKIAEMWVTWDNVAILTQLGLFPPAASEEP